LAAATTTRLHDAKPTCFDRFSHEIEKKHAVAINFWRVQFNRKLNFSKTDCPALLPGRPKKVNASALMAA
jgi:hypothetical protein